MAIKQTILHRAENQVRQQLFGGILLAVAGLMIMTTLGWVKADDITNLTFNVTAGSFTIVNVPNSMAFASQAYGTANNILGNEEIDGATVTDYRGNSTAWTVAVNANTLTSGSDTILPNKLNAYAENGVVSNVENGLTNKVAKGTNGTLNNAGITLINGSTQASGIFQYDNGVVRLTVGTTQAAGTYGAIMVYTLS